MSTEDKVTSNHALPPDLPMLTFPVFIRMSSSERKPYRGVGNPPCTLPGPTVPASLSRVDHYPDLDSIIPVHIFIFWPHVGSSIITVKSWLAFFMPKWFPVNGFLLCISSGR